MNDFVLDASALGKRYAPEPGGTALDHLFTHVEPRRLRCLTVGALETLSIIVRHRNRGTLTPRDAGDAVAALRREVFAGDVGLVSVADDLVFAAADFVERYSINSTDAILLRAALDMRPELQAAGDDLVLVTADKRLVKAGKAEGLTTFDPETEDMASLEALIAAL